MSRGHRLGFGFLLAVAVLASGVLTSRAFENARLELGSIAGEGWSAEALVVRLGWLDASHAHVQLRARSATFPDPVGVISGLQLVCPRASVDAQRMACPAGELTLVSSTLGSQRVDARFDYRFADGRLQLHLGNLRFSGGRATLQGTHDKDGWQLHVTARELEFAGVAGWLAGAGVIPAGLSGDGHIDLEARLHGRGTEPERVRASLSLQASGFSDAAGNLAGEDLELGLSLEAGPVTGGWEFEVELSARQGQFYAAPLFIEVPEAAIRAGARLQWLPESARLLVHSLHYHHPGTARLQATGVLDLGQGPLLESLAVDLEEGVFPSLYATYLQPWLIDTVLAELETQGRLAGDLRWRNARLERVQLDLQDVSVDDLGQRFGLMQVQGQLDWGDDAEARRSRLQWDSGHVYRVALGPAELFAESRGTRFHLPQAAAIPVLDGELQLDEFSLDFSGGEDLRWRVDGFLTPISMQRLTRALGWQEFAGKLSGVVPEVRYEGGDLEVGGMLLLRVFDGEITLSNLRMEKPLGIVPRLWVDAQVNAIDLELLTGTFSFGRIEGRLDGAMDGLYMEAWLPVSFDAWFATPVDDKSRHRISQKAVQNISDIGGGGVGDALSRGILGFFEDFPYDRLGISCRLENGICDMGGVAPAPNGYYIVKGRLLPPRLNVIGYSERVDWDHLIAQIIAVTKRKGAVVQ